MILSAHTHNNARSPLRKHDQVVFTIYRHHTERLYVRLFVFFFVNPSRSGIQLWLPRTVGGLTWNHHRTLAPMKFRSKKKFTYWCQINQHHESKTRECWSRTNYISLETHVCKESQRRGRMSVCTRSSWCNAYHEITFRRHSPGATSNHLIIIYLPSRKKKTNRDCKVGALASHIPSNLKVSKKKTLCGKPYVS